MSVLQKDCQQIFVQNWNQTFCFVDGYAELENDNAWKIGLAICETLWRENGTWLQMMRCFLKRAQTKLMISFNTHY